MSNKALITRLFVGQRIIGPNNMACTIVDFRHKTSNVRLRNERTVMIVTYDGCTAEEWVNRKDVRKFSYFPQFELTNTQRDVLPFLTDHPQTAEEIAGKMNSRAKPADWTTPQSVAQVLRSLWLRGRIVRQKFHSHRYRYLIPGGFDRA